MGGSGTSGATLSEVIAFAEEDENIRVVVVTGSAARGETHPLSDLDVELYVRDPQPLLLDDSWHSRFGRVVAVEVLPNPGWHPTRLLYLKGAKKIDFMIAPVTALRDAGYDRPIAVVVNKDGLATDLPPSRGASGSPPSPDEFLECVNWFAAAAIMCAKSIMSDDPWMAKVRDWDLKRELLRMIEWDHKLRHGVKHDTWFLGKNMNQWMDAEIRSRVAECWGRFDHADSTRALTASVRLFHDLAPRVGQAISAPNFDHEAVADEVSEILRPRA